MFIDQIIVHGEFPAALPDKTFAGEQTVFLHFREVKGVGTDGKTAFDRFYFDFAGVIFGNIDVISITDQPDRTGFAVGIGFVPDDSGKQFHRFVCGGTLLQQDSADHGSP